MNEITYTGKATPNLRWKHTTNWNNKLLEMISSRHELKEKSEYIVMNAKIYLFSGAVGRFDAHSDHRSLCEHSNLFYDQ
jgi:hypothetical protein